MSELVSAEEPGIQIHAEVTRQIRQHARGSMTTEVCGVLIGDVAGAEPVEIFASIAAVNAAQAGTHVTFTQDAWEHIYSVKDKEFPEARIVGWYHSHPGFGVFLSEHDTFIQENFFSAATQVAWVFDPHTDEEGCFGWVDGRIARLGSITVVDRGSPVEVTESRGVAAAEGTGEEGETAGDVPALAGRRRPWLRWTVGVAALLLALATGFAVARIVFPSLYPLVLPINPMSGEPMLRDPKTGEPVYLDPQRGRYVVEDRRTGRLTSLDLEALKGAGAAGTDPLGLSAPAVAPAPLATPGREQEKKK